MLSSDIDSSQLIDFLKLNKDNLLKKARENRIYGIYLIAPPSPTHQTRLNLMCSGNYSLAQMVNFKGEIKNLLQEAGIKREGDYSIAVELFNLEGMRSNGPFQNIFEPIIHSAVKLEEIGELKDNSLNAEWEKRSSFKEGLSLQPSYREEMTKVGGSEIESTRDQFERIDLSEGHGRKRGPGF